MLLEIDLLFDKGLNVNAVGLEMTFYVTSASGHVIDNQTRYFNNEELVDKRLLLLLKLLMNQLRSDTESNCFIMKPICDL